MRMLARVASLKQTSPETFQQILDLTVFPSLSDLDPDLQEHYNSVASFVAPLINHDQQELSTLCHIINCNCFGVQDAFALGVFDVGVGLYPSLSSVKHSCAPTCNLASSTNKVMSLRAMTSGSEVSINKLSSLMMPLKDRKKELESMGIDCDCRRCLDPQAIQVDEVVHGWVCQKCRSGLLFDCDDDCLQCRDCDEKTLKSDIVEIQQKMVQFIHLGNSLLRQTEYAKAMKVFEKVLSNFGKFITVDHSSLPTIRLPLLVCCEQLKEFDKGLDHGNKALEVMKKVYPENHPKVAEILFHLASVFVKKSEVVVESTKKRLNKKQAELLFKQSMAIREICFGTEDLNTKECVKRLDALWK
ncbi:hypothetical protein GEMRC1_007809 [Eukaryota sp. GEM-RC1]